MRVQSISALAAIAIGAAALTACDDYHHRGGYAGVAVGTVWPYWGWWGDYYYPGVGIYVYDIDRRPYRWTERQREYWTWRRDGWREREGRRPSGTPNWNDFNRAMRDRDRDRDRDWDRSRSRDRDRDRTPPRS